MLTPGACKGHLIMHKKYSLLMSRNNLNMHHILISYGIFTCQTVSSSLQGLKEDKESAGTLQPMVEVRKLDRFPEK